MADVNNAIAEIQATVATMNAEFEAARKAFQEKMQGNLKGVFKAFFDSHPEVVGIAWTQYTPYFNDGDECVFGRNEFFYTKSKEKLEEASSSYDLEDDYDNPTGESGELSGHYKRGGGYPEFAKALESIPEEVYKETFGDHSFIIATASGFDVREYEHD